MLVVQNLIVTTNSRCYFTEVPTDRASITIAKVKKEPDKIADFVRSLCDLNHAAINEHLNFHKVCNKIKKHH